MSWTILLIVIVHSFVLSGAFDCKLEPRNTEGRIKKKLICEGYDRLESPQSSAGEVVNVSLQMTVASYNMFTYSGIFSAATFLHSMFVDPRLAWDKSNFDNIDRVALKSSEIWVPPYFTYNGFKSYGVSCLDTNCVIENDGSVYCYLPCRLQAMCLLSFDNWPYDAHNCTIDIGITTQKDEGIIYKPANGGIIVDIRSDPNFKLIGFTTDEFKENHNETENLLTSYMKYTFVAERYGVIEIFFIIPAIFILVLLNLFTVWIDPRSKERFILPLLALFCALYIFQYIRNAHVGKLGNFFLKIFILSAVTLFESIVLYTIISKENDPTALTGFIHKITDNRLGEIFLIRNYMIEVEPKKPRKFYSTDVNDIAESLRTKNSFGNLFSKLVDRIYFVIVLFTFTIMFAIAMPRRTIFGKFNNYMEGIHFEDWL